MRAAGATLSGGRLDADEGVGLQGGEGGEGGVALVAVRRTLAAGQRGRGVTEAVATR